MWRERQPPKIENAKKLTFEGKVTEACWTAGESNARIVTYEDFNVTFDGPGFKVNWLADACRDDTSVRVTIEPVNE
jgi:hypothetical protein